jgi:hypothetical protein
MDNREKTKRTIKNGQSRENQMGNQEWTIERKPKGQSRMNNREKIKGTIKNGQSRENQRDNQEWTIERKPKGQSRMDYREKTKGTIKNEQSRYTGNIWYTRQGLRQAKKKKKTQHRKQIL